MKILLKLEESQAEILIRALDFYSRIGLGQFPEIINRFKEFDWNTDYIISERYSLIGQLENISSQLTGLCTGAYRGICGCLAPISSQIAYEILQVVRHKIAWHNETEGGITVKFDEPLKISGLELPICHIEDSK